jgi:hydrogenase maturation protein HypF
VIGSTVNTSNVDVLEARRVLVRGVVQGVGFRPFVTRLAGELGIEGQVANVGGVVEVTAQGSSVRLEEFLRRLKDDAPCLAVIDGVTACLVPLARWHGFGVLTSVPGDATAPRLVPPDVAPCHQCLAELFNPADRRYRYPFINCSDCGPRFTIIDDLPYDRCRTSMSSFSMCSACRREYADPTDRRFHAEPIACPRCGPQLRLIDLERRPIRGDAIAVATEMLADGHIVAVKGAGGYHLACDASNDDAVRQLRQRKCRPHKPLAVMVATIADAESIVHVEPAEATLLDSWRAPITLLRDRGRLPRSIAPGHRRLGVMLPSTPLHHLLLHDFGGPLVMTSGNRNGEAICIDDADVCDALSGIADAALTHDRRILQRCDDSVAAARLGEFSLVRRARGYAPTPIRLPIAVRPTLAVSAELQSSFCVAAGDHAYVSQHIGDLDNEQTLAAFTDAITDKLRLLRIDPETVAHDLHPDLLSTRVAETFGLPCVAVQHHHGHVAAVMAEHHLRGPVIGVALDGFGLGTDGTGWGGEFLVADWAQSERLGSLRPVGQPGGDAAVRQPWRMAVAHADAADRLDAVIAAFECSPIPRRAVEDVGALCRSGVACPLTSSAGRLFDAVAAITGVCLDASYEGQPAMLLEQVADPAARDPIGFALVECGDGFQIDTRPLFAQIVDLVSLGVAVDEIAGRFHHTLASIIRCACRRVRDEVGLTQVCLGGGVFANSLLSTLANEALVLDGFSVFLPRNLPPGDGGLSVGQALVAHAHRSIASGS